MNKKIILMMIVLISISSMGELYRVSVDSDYGFYKVRNVNNPEIAPNYEERTLKINSGDTIEWINDADPDEKLTLDCFKVIDKNTFRPIFYEALRWNYHKYSYTFTEGGVYTIHIEEYLKIESQTIKVYDILPENIEDLSVITTPNIVEDDIKQDEGKNITDFTSQEKPTMIRTIILMFLGIIIGIILLLIYLLLRK